MIICLRVFWWTLASLPSLRLLLWEVVLPVETIYMSSCKWTVSHWYTHTHTVTSSKSQRQTQQETVVLCDLSLSVFFFFIMARLVGRFIKGENFYDTENSYTQIYTRWTSLPGLCYIQTSRIFKFFQYFMNFYWFVFNQIILNPFPVCWFWLIIFLLFSYTVHLNLSFCRWAIVVCVYCMLCVWCGCVGWQEELGKCTDIILHNLSVLCFSVNVDVAQLWTRWAEIHHTLHLAAGTKDIWNRKGGSPLFDRAEEWRDRWEMCEPPLELLRRW